MITQTNSHFLIKTESASQQKYIHNFLKDILKETYVLSLHEVALFLDYTMGNEPTILTDDEIADLSVFGWEQSDYIYIEQYKDGEDYVIQMPLPHLIDN